jgi:hypothetical protein
VLEGELTKDEVKPAKNEPAKGEAAPAMAGSELCSKLAVYLATRRQISH